MCPKCPFIFRFDLCFKIFVPIRTESDKIDVTLFVLQITSTNYRIQMIPPYITSYSYLSELRETLMLTKLWVWFSHDMAHTIWAISSYMWNDREQQVYCKSKLSLLLSVLYCRLISTTRRVFAVTSGITSADFCWRSFVELWSRTNRFMGNNHMNKF